MITKSFLYTLKKLEDDKKVKEWITDNLWAYYNFTENWIAKKDEEILEYQAGIERLRKLVKQIIGLAKLCEIESVLQLEKLGRLLGRLLGEERGG